MRGSVLLRSLRTLGACCTLALAACAHRPTTETAKTPMIVPTAPAGDTAGALPAPPEALPKAAMPSEWRNGGDEYDDLFDRLRDGFTLDEVDEPAIEQQLAWFVHNPDYMERTFQRAQRYLYHIICEVEARSMPLEFALLPVVESAYEPFAYSPSRASGLWQFIPSTGERFGLKRNWWYDGRRDVVDSTRAALDYLQILHDQFNGDWLLAIAAYNVGELAVQRAIDRNEAAHKPTDFWHLKLPAETRAYVPKLLALKRLLVDPERYGLAFSVIPNEPYFAVVETQSQIDLKIAARLSSSSFDEVVALNAGFNRWATDPAGPHRLLVPIDHADALESALQALPPEERVLYVQHAVEPRETLASIAARYGTSSAVIAKLNDLEKPRVTPGQVLRVPEDSAQLPDKVLAAALRVDKPSTDVALKRRQIVHRVRAGETLRSIARRHGTDAATIARINGIGASERLVAGQRLVIKTVARKYRGESASTSRRVVYVVRHGDTLHGISRKYQVSVEQLKSWNGIDKTHAIRAGQRLVMYMESNRRHS